MDASRLGAMGLTGMLLFLAGLHLLWQARGEVFFWLEEFLRIFRGEFAKRGGMGIPARTWVRAGEPAQSGRRTLRMVAAFALMVLGPVLFLIDLRF
jgi:hypothetical protein